VALSQNKDAREKQLANLHKFQPGVSGNPGGRPKRKPFLEEIERWMAGHPEDVTAAIKRAFASAKLGDLATLRELMDRVDGPITTKQEITGADGGPVEHTIKFDGGKSDER
jgi:hypothetical protein